MPGLATGMFVKGTKPINIPKTCFLKLKSAKEIIKTITKKCEKL